MEPIIKSKILTVQGCTAKFKYYKYFVMGGNKYSFDLLDIGHYFLDYQKLMNHWHKHFPSEILDAEYEQLIFNQEKISRQIIDYIEVEWDDKCLEFHKNKRAVRTSSNLQVRKPIYDNSINKWKNYKKHLEPLITILNNSN